MSSSIVFTQRSLDEIDNTREGTRGRVSYPIVKGFMETGYQLAEVTQEGLGRKPQTLALLLRSYVETHKQPLKVILRKNRLYLLRLDIDADGNPIEGWREKFEAEKRALTGDVEDITSEVVDRE